MSGLFFTNHLSSKLDLAKLISSSRNELSSPDVLIVLEARQRLLLDRCACYNVVRVFCISALFLLHLGIGRARATMAFASPSSGRLYLVLTGSHFEEI